jgi:hypothetical protein
VTEAEFAALGLELGERTWPTFSGDRPLVLQGGDLALMGAQPAQVVDRVPELGWNRSAIRSAEAGPSGGREVAIT